MSRIDDGTLANLERQYASGLTSGDLIDVCAAHGIQLSEANLRKYVQLGLLPRSVRVGRKGKHRGSQGRYPVAVIRQIDAVRTLMAQGYTIQDIQRELLSLRTDIDALGQKLAQVLSTMEQAAAEVEDEGAARPGDDIAARAISDARQVGDALIERLRAIEQRLAMRARMARAAV